MSACTPMMRNELPLVIAIVGQAAGLYVSRVLTFAPGEIAINAGPASFVVQGERSERGANK
jgi:hypothetical protein